MDLVEDFTTGQADAFAVNSKFTSRIFRREFPRIRKEPEIVYPGISLGSYDRDVDLGDVDVKRLKTKRKTVLSFNRFERKKTVQLALEAFALFRDKEKSRADAYRLVLAGGQTSLQMPPIPSDHLATYRRVRFAGLGER
jgi:alpha-1,3/alpha-1,6-mannosyltransferase